MIVSVVLRFTPEQWKRIDEDAYDGVFMGVRANFEDAQKLALQLRRESSQYFYLVRKIRIK